MPSRRGDRDKSARHLDDNLPECIVDPYDPTRHIGPTLLSLMGFDYTSWFWGDDILDGQYRERALIGNYQKLGLYEDGKLVILAPGNEIDLMENPQTENHIRPISAHNPFALKAISYYQGADFVLKHKMNRWH